MKRFFPLIILSLVLSLLGIGNIRGIQSVSVPPFFCTGEKFLGRTYSRRSHLWGADFRLSAGL